MFCGPEIRNQKSEGRAGGWTFSVVGLRISFGFRISDFGFRQILTDFRAPSPGVPSFPGRLKRAVPAV